MTKKELGQLLNAAPVVLVIVMMMAFIFMFTIQMFHYQHAFAAILPSPTAALMAGIGVGLITQGMRIGFGLASALNFSRGETFKGWVGIFFSLSLTGVESYEAYYIANSHEVGSDLYSVTLMILQLIVWSAFFVETRLALTYNHKDKSDKNDTNDEVDKLLDSVGKLNGVRK